MTYRNRTARTAAGGVISSGLDARSSYERPRLTPSPFPMRAVVINTYVTDDANNRSKVSVECDVVLIRSNVPLPRVRVAQRNHGALDVHDVWVPKPSTRLVGGGELILRGGTASSPSMYRDMDGDHVYVQFVEGDIDRPLITHAGTHERAAHLVTGLITDSDASLGWKETDPRRGSPRRNEMYTRHAGTEFRINGQGDVVIDSVGAYTDATTETPDDNVGQIRIRVKNSQRFTVEMDGVDVLEVWKDGAQVRIDLGEGAAQRLILGDDFRQFLNDWLTYVFKEHQHTAGTLVAGTTPVTLLTGPVSPVTVPPLVPPLPLSYTGSSMSADLLSDLAKTKKS